MDKNPLNYDKLSKKPLGILETQMLASNLNRIEREREHQNNPGTETYLFGILVGILVFPFGGYIAVQMLGQSQTIFEMLFILVTALSGVWFDCNYIKLNWYYLTKDIGERNP